ncbi:DUF2155 domain-containing protein [Aliiroseovarius sp. YM-037]|uniref:DUF2155 domain-containing protein n=1 Tax=Aliiroseovarius sp. YM-037 TaxID=3341728 RepID=UPI003A7F66D3
MRRALAIALVFLATGAVAQEPVNATDAAGAVLRGLDKVNGNLTDYEMQVGDHVDLGRLDVELVACRFPTDNPAGDAFANIVVSEKEADAPLFKGWMVASSPALNALDHPRYDVWVLRCTTS